MAFYCPLEHFQQLLLLKMHFSCPTSLKEFNFIQILKNNNNNTVKEKVESFIFNLTNAIFTLYRSWILKTKLSLAIDKNHLYKFNREFNGYGFGHHFSIYIFSSFLFSPWYHPLESYKLFFFQQTCYYCILKAKSERRIKKEWKINFTLETQYMTCYANDLPWTCSIDLV